MRNQDIPRRRTGGTWARTLVGLALAVSPLRCASTTAGGDSGSQTHWLDVCTSTADCRSLFTCECGRCTLQCSRADTCSDLGPAVCVSLPAGCAVSHSSKICLRACSAGCGDAETCRDGACVPGDDRVAGTGGVSGSGGATSTGGGASGGSDVGGSSAGSNASGRDASAGDSGERDASADDSGGGALRGWPDAAVSEADGGFVFETPASVLAALSDYVWLVGAFEPLRAFSYARFIPAAPGANHGTVATKYALCPTCGPYFVCYGVKGTYSIAPGGDAGTWQITLRGLDCEDSSTEMTWTTGAFLPPSHLTPHAKWELPLGDHAAPRVNVHGASAFGYPRKQCNADFTECVTDL